MGDTVWTYVRRATDEPEPVQGVIKAILNMPSTFPPEQFLIEVHGNLVVRDKYTCAYELENVRVFVRDDQTVTYHD